MSSEIKIKCRNPHEFLISVVYSLSYASTVRGPALHHSLLGLGYIFSALDIPTIFNISAPDFLLINTQHKTVIAVECKGDIVENSKLDKLKEKFSERVVDAVRSAVQDSAGEYIIEFVIHTFDIYGDYYAKVAHNINKEVGHKVLLWTTTAIPQVRADASTRGPVEYYTLKKYVSSSYVANHNDEDLDRLLTQGILISENDIVCNPLVDPDVSYQVLFYEVSEYILRAAISDRYRGQRVEIVKFVQNIKRDYQSHVKTDRLLDVVIDIFSIFPWLGEVRTSSYEILFKKRPRLDIEDFYNVREKIIGMSDNEAKRYVRELKLKRSKR